MIDLSPYEYNLLMQQCKDAAWIYKTDMAYIDKCLGVIAWVDHPSFGVGMEIQHAHEKNIPILFISNKSKEDTSLSLMVRGLYKEYVSMQHPSGIGLVKVPRQQMITADTRMPWKEIFEYFVELSRTIQQNNIKTKESSNV